MTAAHFPAQPHRRSRARVVMEEEGGKLPQRPVPGSGAARLPHFVVGTPAEQMPVIVPRICGVCSTAHHVASVKALEKIRVTPHRWHAKSVSCSCSGSLFKTRRLRFIFTMPDRVRESLFDMDEGEEQRWRSFPSPRGAEGAQARHRASIIGGWAVHPPRQSAYWRRFRRNNPASCRRAVEGAAGKCRPSPATFSMPTGICCPWRERPYWHLGG